MHLNCIYIFCQPDGVYLITHKTLSNQYWLAVDYVTTCLCRWTLSEWNPYQNWLAKPVGAPWNNNVVRYKLQLNKLTNVGRLVQVWQPPFPYKHTHTPQSSKDESASTATHDYAVGIRCRHMTHASNIHVQAMSIYAQRKHCLNMLR